jgi:superfamily I DNA/RNA helicase
MTVRTTRDILSYLETGNPVEMAEEARKIYVAASRAQRLLVIAAPRSQAERLAAHIRAARAPVTVVNL